MIYQELRALDKNTLINLGFERIREDLKLDKTYTEVFDKVAVFANHYEIKIEFLNPIKFIPLHTEFYYDITVQLVQQTTSYSIYSNGTEKKNALETPFFIPTQESEQAIRFVMAAINRSEGRNENETRQEFLKDFDGELIIRDEKDHYNITRKSVWQESWYKINKKSGEIFDGGHGHMEPCPEKEEYRFIEIE